MYNFIKFSERADDELENKLDKNFNKDYKTFNCCVKWFREVNSYLATLNDPKVFYNPTRTLSNGTFMYDMGDIGSLNYDLFTNGNKVYVWVYDFYFEDFELLEWKYSVLDLIDEMNKSSWK